MIMQFGELGGEMCVLGGGGGGGLWICSIIGR